MLGRPRRNTSVLDLLVFILVAAIGIMEAAIIATPITAVIIIKVIILTGMGITITAAVMRIMVADRDITAAARCQPFRIDLIPRHAPSALVPSFRALFVRGISSGLRLGVEIIGVAGVHPSFVTLAHCA